MLWLHMKYMVVRFWLLTMAPVATTVILSRLASSFIFLMMYSVCPICPYTRPAGKEMIDLHNKLILAPMAGITDLPFRLLCKEQGCDVLFQYVRTQDRIAWKKSYPSPESDLVF